MLIVYFSSVSENTHRFVGKLQFKNKRIPIFWEKEPLLVDEPFVLFTPTYGGGGLKGAVPKQVVKFLNIESNRNLLRAVVSLGNRNFGEAYCLAGKLISNKTGAPVIGDVEVFGTPEDVLRITQKINDLEGINDYNYD